MTRRAHLSILVYLVIYQLCIQFGSASYLRRLQAKIGKLTGNSAYKFVKELFEIEDEVPEASLSKKYVSVIQVGVRYLENGSLECLSEDTEKLLAKNFCKNVVNVLLHLHYEACQELKLPSPALEKWEGRASVRDADHLEFVQELFGLEDINNKYYEQRIAKLVQKTVAYLRLETQGKGEMAEDLENANRGLIGSLKSLCSSKLPKNCKLAMFAVYQALSSDSTKEDTNSTTSEHPLAQSNEGNPIISDCSTKHDDSMAPTLVLLGTESNQPANIAPCRKSSRLKGFNHGKTVLGYVGRRNFAISFFGIEPGFCSTTVRPYDRLIKMSIEYFEHRKLDNLKLRLEQMIGRPFSTSIASILLHLHYEVCQELNELPSPALAKWNNKDKIKPDARANFVQELFGLRHMNIQKYEERIAKLAQQTVEYLGLKAQCKEDMNEGLENAKKRLISSLKSLYGCELSEISKLAMFAVYRALRSGSTKADTNSTTSGHLLGQPKRDGSVIDNCSIGQNHHMLPLALVENRSNKPADFASYGKRSILEEFNRGGTVSKEVDRENFVKIFFGIMPDFRNTVVRPYNELIEMSIEYFKAGELDNLKLRLEQMIGKRFPKNITSILLHLHHEACQELELSSPTLETWSKRTSLEDDAREEFVQKLFGLEYMNNKYYEQRIAKLVQQIVGYLRLEAQSKENMAKGFANATEQLIKSLKSLHSCNLPGQHKRAIFAVYRALSSNSTSSYPQLPLSNRKLLHEFFLHTKIDSSLPSVGKATCSNKQTRMQLSECSGQLSSSAVPLVAQNRTCTPVSLSDLTVCSDFSLINYNFGKEEPLIHTYVTPEFQAEELHNLLDPSNSYGTQTNSFPSSPSLPIYSSDDEEILTFLSGSNVSKGATSVASTLESFEISSDPALVTGPTVPSLEESTRHISNEYQSPVGIEPPSLFPILKGNSNASNMPLNTAIQNTSTSVEDLAEQEVSTLFYGPQSPEGLPVADPEPIPAPSNTPHSFTTSEQGQHWIDCELVDMNEYKFFEQLDEIEGIESDQVWNEMLGWI